MQRQLIIAAGALALTACSHFDGMMDHHGDNYRNLAKIAKQQDAQNALLFTRDGKLVVVNVATGEIVEPGERKRSTKDVMQNSQQHDMAMEQTRVSDEEFAEIKRKFDSTIKIDVTRGSVCMNIAADPPGKQWMICSPPYPRWW